MPSDCPYRPARLPRHPVRADEFSCGGSPSRINPSGLPDTVIDGRCALTLPGMAPAVTGLGLISRVAVSPTTRGLGVKAGNQFRLDYGMGDLGSARVHDHLGKLQSDGLSHVDSGPATPPGRRGPRRLRPGGRQRWAI